MSKQLTHREVLAVLQEAIEGDVAIDTEDKVRASVSGLAGPVADHLGCSVSSASSPHVPRTWDEAGDVYEDVVACWVIGFLPTASTPGNGGPLAQFDPDVSLADWWQQGGLDSSDLAQPAGVPATAATEDWRDVFERITSR